MRKKIFMNLKTRQNLLQIISEQCVIEFSVYFRFFFKRSTPSFIFTGCSFQVIVKLAFFFLYIYIQHQHFSNTKSFPALKQFYIVHDFVSFFLLLNKWSVIIVAVLKTKRKRDFGRWICAILHDFTVNDWLLRQRNRVLEALACWFHPLVFW